MSSGACSCQGTVHEPRCLLAPVQSPSPEWGRIERVTVSDPALLRIAAAAERIASALEAKSPPPAPSVPPSPPVPYVPRVGDVVRMSDYTFVLVDFTPNVEIRKAWILERPKWSEASVPAMDSWSHYWPGPVSFVRPATPAERVAAGLDAPVPPSDAPSGVNVPLARAYIAGQADADTVRAVYEAPVAAATPAATKRDDVSPCVDDSFASKADECARAAKPTPAATTSEARPTWGPGVPAVEEAYRPAPAAKPTTPDADKGRALFDALDEETRHVNAAHAAFIAECETTGIASWKPHLIYRQGYLAGLRARSGAGR